MPDSDRPGYEDIDGDPETVEMVDAMQTAAGDEAVRVYKRQSHDLLDLGPGDRVLDAGCGPGADVLTLADRVGPDGEAIGVDKSSEMVDAARSSADDTPGGHTEEFLSIEHTIPRHPTLGRRVYRLARGAGLVGIDLAPFALPVTDYDLFRKGMHIEDYTDAMVEAGEVTAAEAEEWVEGMRRAGDEDRFLYTVTQFTVVGTVPEGG